MAAPAESVQIYIHAVFDPAVETFTASDAFCPKGEAETWGFFQAARTFHLFKTLTCEDGSTLTIRVEANLTPTGTIGGWNVVEGTGDWAGAHGGGLIVGAGFDGGIDDTYTGMFKS